MMDLQEQVTIIEKSERMKSIEKYATICECGFTFVTMEYYVVDGNAFCECGDCGEVNLLES